VTDAPPLIGRQWLIALVAGEAVFLANVAFVPPDRQFIAALGATLAVVVAGFVYRVFRPIPGMWRWSYPGVSRAPFWLMVLTMVVVMLTLDVALHVLGAGDEDGWIMVQTWAGVMAWTPLNRWWARRHPPSAPEPAA
jgi:hypothetical protein